MNGVSKVYESAGIERRAVDNVDCQIKNGHICAVIGPTGCGKTTLLNMVGGFETPTTGVIYVNGAPVTGPSPSCGYVFQEANLFPWLRVKENILFAVQHGKGVNTDGASKAELSERADDYLERLGLSDAAKLYPYQISGGMRARAALGRVLLANTKVLLMDEPFAAVDALTRASLHRLLLEQLALDRDRSVLLITHDIEEALILAHDVLVMSPSPGKIQKSYRVPFEWPRKYDEIIGDPELSRQKRLILEDLNPFIQ